MFSDSQSAFYSRQIRHDINVRAFMCVSSLWLKLRDISKYTMWFLGYNLIVDKHIVRRAIERI